MDLDEAAEKLTHYSQLDRAGFGRRQQRALLRSGDLVRVHDGWYADGADWTTAYSEGRQLRRVAAVAASMRSGGAVFSHTSAAAIWGLPLYRWDPARAHVTLRRGAGASSTGGVFRHRDDLPDDDITERHGLLCTSLERTVVDLARSVPTETALVIADAALRAVAHRPGIRRYDVDAALRLRDAMWRLLGTMQGKRGVRQARWVLEHADGRAELPGESVSRHHLIQLGYTAVRLQVHVPGPAGADYFVDLGLDESHAWGEFDGKAKYTDPMMLDGRSPAEVLRAEKEREDWIRATTGRPIARWGFEHLVSPEGLARRLAVYGIRAPRRRRSERT
ncbi:hypothetical protein [Microbacterium sp. CFBP9034]|uniref:type IV toxin-antitoxin system AbiEi family antitoxin domain-containing protein n=1 Tax=Microbacterium sp. CFBP9034 TaxID=3096540 RepID=UPI002A6AB35B|nr:hypothetical protein [Microbacterium sp. CFBP9034]MDY0910509.1 hypothetical protein [Microbacterium sp. CFBP9034]